MLELVLGLEKEPDAVAQCDCCGNIHNNSPISDLFGLLSLLNYKNVPAQSIAMPIIGAGFQGNSIENK